MNLWLILGKQLDSKVVEEVRLECQEELEEVEVEGVGEEEGVGEVRSRKMRRRENLALASFFCLSFGSYSASMGALLFYTCVTLFSFRL